MFCVSLYTHFYILRQYCMKLCYSLILYLITNTHTCMDTNAHTLCMISAYNKDQQEPSASKGLAHTSGENKRTIAQRLINSLINE